MEHYTPPIPPLERILLSLSPDALSERFMSSKIPKTVAPPLSQLHRTNTHRIGRADCQAPFGTAWRQTPSSCHISYGAPWCRDRLVWWISFYLRRMVWYVCTGPEKVIQVTCDRHNSHVRLNVTQRDHRNIIRAKPQATMTYTHGTHGGSIVLAPWHSSTQTSRTDLI